jgi:hypothetical protein
LDNVYSDNVYLLIGDEEENELNIPDFAQIHDIEEQDGDGEQAQADSASVSGDSENDSGVNDENQQPNGDGSDEDLFGDGSNPDDERPAHTNRRKRRKRTPEGALAKTLRKRRWQQERLVCALKRSHL